MTMKNPNILISGAGIAGPTLAYWLQRYCFKPTVVELASRPRQDGYLLVPGSALLLRLRNQVLKSFALPVASRLLARMTYGRMFRESFALKDYAAA